MAWNHAMPRGAARAGLVLALLLPAGVWGANPTSGLAAAATPTVTEVGGKTLKEWIADLKNSDPSVREEAIRAIILFPNAEEAAPALIDRLNDSDASPRIKAVMALGQIPIADEKTRAKVVEAMGNRIMEDSQAPIRYDAVMVLLAMGKDAKTAIPSLVHAVEEDYSCFEIRRAAIAVLMAAGGTEKGPDQRVTRALLTALNDRAAGVRLEAIMALGSMGRPDDGLLLAQVVRSLKDKQADKDKTVAIWAHLSTMAIDKVDDADVQYLLDCTKPSETMRVRAQAIRALGACGSKAKQQVIPVLLNFLADKDPEVVGNACLAMAQFDDPGAAAEKALGDVAQNAALPGDVKSAAVQALGAVGKKSPSAVPMLVALLADRDPEVASSACTALGDIDNPGPDAEKALAALSVSKDAEEAVTKAAGAALDTLHKKKK